MIPNNPIAKIKDPKKRSQVTAICKGLQILYRDLTKNIDSVIQEMSLPLTYHMFITGNFSDLMALKYN